MQTNVIIYLVVGITALGIAIRFGMFPGRSLGGDSSIVAFEKLTKAIWRWGWALLAFGVFNLFSSGFKDLYGLLLIALGGMSFYYNDDPAIFVPYAASIFWAGINNSLLGAPFWIATSVVFAGFGIYMLVEYRAYQRKLDPAVASGVSGGGRARRHFPRLGLGLGIPALVGCIFVYAVWISSQGQPSVIVANYYVQQLTTLAALLGLSLSAASLTSKFPGRNLAIGGLVANAIPLLLWGRSMIVQVIQRGG